MDKDYPKVYEDITGLHSTTDGVLDAIMVVRGCRSYPGGSVHREEHVHNLLQHIYGINGLKEQLLDLR